jgi:hypothetical protein
MPIKNFGIVGKPFILRQVGIDDLRYHKQNMVYLKDLTKYFR